MEAVLIILQVLGGLIGLFVLELLVVSLLPVVKAPDQPLEPKPSGETPEAGPRLDKQDVSFSVKGTTVRGWLFLPRDRSGPVPCIVMAHGAGGTMAMGLGLYAARFQEAGFAVLAFDYRHYGQSQGEPRHLLWIPRQLQDWAAAVAYARGLAQVDPERVGLWGTSLSGGHVIVTAARDSRVAAVCAQCPGLDGRASGEMLRHRAGIGYLLRLVPHGQRDLVRSWLGLRPHKIPAVGKEGTMAMMTVPGAYEAFSQLAPAGYPNQVCARILLRGDKYRPVKHAAKVRCPTLLLVCERDELTPAETVEQALARLGDLAEVKRFPIRHFDIYFGRHFNTSLTIQLEFFIRHLAGTGFAADASGPPGPDAGRPHKT
jgi:dienelactone hydrolase